MTTVLLGLCFTEQLIHRFLSIVNIQVNKVDLFILT